MTYTNHDDGYSEEYLQDILNSVRTIAMVGASPDRTKFSYGVLRQLSEIGYDSEQLRNLEGGIRAWARDIDPTMPSY